MYDLLIREISYCFGPRDDPANCFGAPALMEKKHFWDVVDLDDDENVAAMINLAREALSASQSREDEPNADFVKYLIEHGFDINASVPGHECLLVQAAKRDLSPEMFLKLLDLGATPMWKTPTETTSCWSRRKRSTGPMRKRRGGRWPAAW